MRKKSKTQLVRRGHRLKRLAYEVSAMASGARHDGLPSVANALLMASDGLAAAGDFYLNKAPHD